ncbi:hypothetical protein [Sphingomonas lenta]|uniref:Uncharacterized protein n=1 Tax=Sphingomonas lenta TaxID=1141887 RepID=A0A2A2SC90_9SPHN|nr:hypothetical protein [Sphingomonas lenta]PAX06876.1 hypothetical protein CKY28_12420 [Sphingomonas lenta]
MGSERVGALRRAAVLDLFRHCFPDPPPDAIWPFVEDGTDVGAGVERFLRALGGDPASGPNPGALLRVEHRIPDGQAAASWRSELLSGDRSRVEAALAALARAPAPVPDWPAARSLARARMGSRAGLVLEEAAHAAAEQRRVRRSLARCWPERWIASRAGERITALTVEQDEAEARLLESLSAGGADAPHHLARLERANAELAALERAALAARPTDPPPAPATTGDAATGGGELAQLSQALDAATSATDAREAWRAFRWRHHPARPGLDAAARARAGQLGRAANRALDRWEASARLGGRSP